MFGWKRKQAKPPPIEQEEEFPGESEKVAQIKHLCWMAKMSAESIVGLSDAELREEFNQYEVNRYQTMLLEATNLARELRDVFYRDAALHFIVDLLMAAGDEPQAKRLYAVIEVDIIQDAILKNHPRLGAKF